MARSEGSVSRVLYLVHWRKQLLGWVACFYVTTIVFFEAKELTCGDDAPLLILWLFLSDRLFLIRLEAFKSVVKHTLIVH